MIQSLQNSFTGNSTIDLDFSFVFLLLRSIFWAALFRLRVCSLYHSQVGLFSLIFLKRKRATRSKVLEKRESIVSVTSRFSALFDMPRN